MTLEVEIKEKRQTIHTDSYSMSIGELINLYQSAEIDLHPEFQRFYRWTDEQKTNLIESILLGIPLPPIFVAQGDSGVWDVIDGLQRLSTIFEFVGILLDENNEIKPPLKLKRAKYLPSLENKVWENFNNEFNEEDLLTPTQRMDIKRSKLGITIIQRESDEQSKYDLFQRLNTGGSPLSTQEVRNCILVMANKQFYEWLRDLAVFPEFIECVSLSDRNMDERYDMDLALRFVLFRAMPEEELRNIGDLNSFITTKMVEAAKKETFNFQEEETAFKKTFTLLSRTMHEYSFKRYDEVKNKFLWGFTVSAFEVIALGIGYNYRTLQETFDVEQKIKELWISDQVSWAGIAAQTRLPQTVRIGREAFRA